MKLYEIPNKSKIYCEASDGSKHIIFDHIDGMYSHCTTENGGSAHLGASQELEKYKDGYRLSTKSTQ